MLPSRCPTHPSQPYEDCPMCEARIGQAEMNLDPLWAPEGDEHDDLGRYERWLDQRDT